MPGITPNNSPTKNLAHPSVVNEFEAHNNAFSTPPGSPRTNKPQTPVIVANPSVVPKFHQPSLSVSIPTPQLPPNPEQRLPDSWGRWDTCSQTPSYFKGASKFWSSRQDKIPVTSTVSSPLLSELGFSPASHVSSEAFVDPTYIVSHSDQSTLVMANLDPLFVAEIERLEDVKDEIELGLSEDIQLSRVTACNADLIKQLMHAIHDKTKKYALDMKKLGRKFPLLETDQKQKYEADGVALLVKVNKHIDLLMIKFNEAQPQQRPRLATVSGVAHSPAAPQPRDMSAAVIAKAEVKYNTLLNMALTAKQDAEEDSIYLDTASDEKISRLVHKISKYEKLKEKISSSHYDYLEFTAVDKPDEENFDSEKLSTAVNDAVQEITSLVKSLETEDEERGLATLLPRKTEKMKWPTFSGKPGENFIKFKEQFLKVAKQNMTSRSDQLSKLRENLKDFPLTLVPDTMDSLDSAFERLSSTYGDPQRLVNHEIKKLDKVSLIPNCEDGSYTLCTRQQAEWLLQLEIIIVELIKMGSEEEAALDLQRCVFGPQTTSAVLGKFPPVLKHQLIASSKANPGKEKLQVYLDKVKEWSQQALELEKFEPESKQASSKKTIQHVSLKDPQVLLFDPPKPLPLCIVCVETQKKSVNAPQLLHLSSHPTGCQAALYSWR